MLVVVDDTLRRDHLGEYKPRAEAADGAAEGGTGDAGHGRHEQAPVERQGADRKRLQQPVAQVVREVGPGVGVARRARRRQCARWRRRMSSMPRRVSEGSMLEIVWLWGSISAASPPVATTGADTPSSARMASAMPSTWPAKP